MQMAGAAAGGDLQEEDLYGDLGDALLQAEVQQLRTQTASQGEELQAASLRLAQVTKEVEGLRQENTVLTTNISSLYKTAKLEIKRKNKEIAQLRGRAGA